MRMWERYHALPTFSHCKQQKGAWAGLGTGISSHCWTCDTCTQRVCISLKLLSPFQIWNQQPTHSWINEIHHRWISSHRKWLQSLPVANSTATHYYVFGCCLVPSVQWRRKRSTSCPLFTHVHSFTSGHKVLMLFIPQNVLQSKKLEWIPKLQELGFKQWLCLSVHVILNASGMFISLRQWYH